MSSRLFDAIVVIGLSFLLLQSTSELSPSFAQFSLLSFSFKKRPRALWQGPSDLMSRFFVAHLAATNQKKGQEVSLFTLVQPTLVVVVQISSPKVEEANTFLSTLKGIVQGFRVLGMSHFPLPRTGRQFISLVTWKLFKRSLPCCGTTCQTCLFWRQSSKSAQKREHTALSVHSFTLRASLQFLNTHLSRQLKHGLSEIPVQFMSLISSRLVRITTRAFSKLRDSYSAVVCGGRVPKSNASASKLLSAI
jgi:hypothetical protein